MPVFQTGSQNNNFLQAAAMAERAMAHLAQIRQQYAIEKQRQRNEAFQVIANSISGAFRNARAEQIRQEDIKREDAYREKRLGLEQQRIDVSKDLPEKYARANLATSLGLLPDQLPSSQEAIDARRLMLEDQKRKVEQLKTQDEMGQRQAEFLFEAERKIKDWRDQQTFNLTGMSGEELHQIAADNNMTDTDALRVVAGMHPGYVYAPDPTAKQKIETLNQQRASIESRQDLFPWQKAEIINQINSQRNALMNKSVFQPRPSTEERLRSMFVDIPEPAPGMQRITSGPNGSASVMRNSGASAGGGGGGKKSSASELFISPDQLFDEPGGMSKAYNEYIKTNTAGITDATKLEEAKRKAGQDFMNGDVMPRVAANYLKRGMEVLPTPEEYDELNRALAATDNGTLELENEARIRDINSRFELALSFLNDPAVLNWSSMEDRKRANIILRKYGKKGKLLLPEGPTQHGPSPVRGSAPVTDYWETNGLVGG